MHKHLWACLCLYIGLNVMVGILVVTRTQPCVNVQNFEAQRNYIRPHFNLFWQQNSDNGTNQYWL